MPIDVSVLSSPLTLMRFGSQAVAEQEDTMDIDTGPQPDKEAQLEEARRIFLSGGFGMASLLQLVTDPC